MVQGGRPDLGSAQVGEAVLLRNRTMSTVQHSPLPTKLTGWFAVAFSSELPVKGVLRRKVMGEELVVYRTENGQPVVMQGYCPHLGAHFAEGGHVVGNQIRCPFHQIGFDKEGHCSFTPYPNAKLPKISTTSYETAERHGVILAFFPQHPQQKAWPLTENAPPESGKIWTRSATNYWKIRTHPQEVIENSVDLGHFSPIHDFKIKGFSTPWKSDGNYATTTIDVVRSRGLILNKETDMKINLSLSGIGYSMARVFSQKLGWVRVVVMATLVDDQTCEIRTTTQIALPDLGRWNWITKKLADFILVPLIRRETQRDTEGDIRQWDNKIHLDPPGLAQGDGPIGLYRKWVKRFYLNSKLKVAK